MKGKTLTIHGDGSIVRSYLYCEDVAEAFEVVLHKGEVGRIYNIGTKERRVTDVAHDICKLFNMDPEKSIRFVENRPFNDQRYFLDDQKLKNLGWFERTSWEEELKKTIEWYTGNHGWWGDISGALLPHPRMLMMPGGIEQHFDEEEKYESGKSEFTGISSQTKMLVPSPKHSSPKKTRLKFLIYGKNGWIGGLLRKLCEKQGIPYEYGKGRLEDRSVLSADILAVKPTHVFNAAGVIGKSNVDWCESHKIETIRTNVSGTLNLADVCRENGLFMMTSKTK